MRTKSDIATRFAAALALAIALSACSTTPTPNPEPTASGSNSTSGGPTSAPAPATSTVPTASTPTAPDTAYQPATPTSPAKNVPKPVMPSRAKEKSEAGQKAFIKYWLETYNYAKSTGQVGPMNAISGDGCKTCANVEKLVSQQRRDGAWLVGGTLAVKSFSPPKASTSPPNSYYFVQAQVAEASGTFWTPAGNYSGFEPVQARVHSRQFVLQRSNRNSWSMDEVTRGD